MLSWVIKNDLMPWRRLSRTMASEIVGIAEAALAALHVDDGAERAPGTGRPRPRSKLDMPPSTRETAFGGLATACGLTFEVGQIVHVVVERLQGAVERIPHHLVEASFLGLAREHGDAHVHCRLDLGRQDRQHREAARHMEAAQRHREAALEEGTRDVDGARELVGLHADQADERLAAGALDLRTSDVRGERACWSRRSGAYDDLDVGTQHFTTLAIRAPGRRERPACWTECASAAK